MSGLGGGAASASLPFQSLHQQPPAGEAVYTATPTEQHAEPRQERGAPRRQTYKSCDFCAKRKRKCDGKLPRCSLCVEKNQAQCHYQLKRPTKPRAGKPAAARPRPSTSAPASTSYATLLASSATACSDGVGIGVGGVAVGGMKRLAGQPAVAYGGNALAVPGARVVAMEPRLMSLKRCRLSASPATGMVGMQENVFLGDFFGCLGILPLATESIVRDAMVETMMRAMAPQQQQQFHHQQFLGGGAHDVSRESPGFGFGFGRPNPGCEDGETDTGWSGGGLAGGATDGSPGRCIMWCAIALGALVKGAPIEYVTGYVSLAREALANCFDGSSIENARAYLMMSFLHGLINDGEKNAKYLSFARSILSKLRPADVPTELTAMLLTTEKMTMFSNATYSEMDGVLSKHSEHEVDLPQVGEVLDQKDLVNLFLLNDRKLSEAFMTDMVAQGILGADPDGVDDAAGEIGLQGRGEEVMGEFLDQPGGGNVLGEGRDLMGGLEPRTRVEEVVGMNLPGCCGPTPSCGGLDSRGREPPCAGTAVKTYIQEALPGLSRLSKTLGRSDSTSGVGGVFYHSTVAYMQVVNGEMLNSFESLKACAEVVQRYPGIVRFRPHLLHCILAASHAWDRGMYDSTRKVYNSIGHAGCRPAPPFEEWAGMRQLCDHVFCRSVAREVHVIYKTKRSFEPVFASASDIDQGEVTASPSSSSSSSPPPSSSPLDVDAAVASWTGVPPGPGSKSGDHRGVPSSASGPVLAVPVRAGPTMAEADVVLNTELPSIQQHATGQDAGSTAAYGGGTAPESHQHNLTDLMATAGALAPAPAYPAMAAAAASAGWPGATAGQELEPVTRGVAAAAGVPELGLASTSMGKDFGARQEDMGVGMTDADLLDISAVLMSEEGPLDDLP